MGRPGVIRMPARNVAPNAPCPREGLWAALDARGLCTRCGKRHGAALPSARPVSRYTLRPRLAPGERP